MHRWKKFFLWLALLGLSILIFGFSGQNAAESTDVSQGLLAKIFGCFPGFHGLSKEQQLELLIQYDKPIRKTAHFLIYALLGFLAACQSQLYDMYGLRQTRVVVPATFLYACSDELHQRFVPGRSGQWSDVFLDTVGAVTGYLIFLGFSGLCRKFRNKREYN